MKERLEYYSARLLRSMGYLLDDYTIRLNRATETLSTFDQAFSHHTFTVDHLFSRLHASMALAVRAQSQPLLRAVLASASAIARDIPSAGTMTD